MTAKKLTVLECGHTTLDFELVATGHPDKNVARHLMESSDTATLALASDLLEVQEQIPGAALDWLADGMPMLAAERRGELVETAERLRAERKPS